MEFGLARNWWAIALRGVLAIVVTPRSNGRSGGSGAKAMVVRADTLLLTTVAATASVG